MKVKFSHHLRERRILYRPRGSAEDMDSRGEEHHSERGSKSKIMIKFVKEEKERVLYDLTEGKK